MFLVEDKADDFMIVRTMEKGEFVRVNDSFKAKVGFDAAELAEKPFLDWIDSRDRTMVQAALENNERSFFARHITRDGNTLQLRIQLAEHDDGLFALGRCAKLPTQIESAAARSAEATVSGTLDAIARIIEEQNPGYKCSILLVADGRFVFGAGPSLPEDYNAAVDGYAIGPTVGSCGTAIFWNTPVIVEDIQADPLWSPLASLAKKAGVAACWSHPFVSSSGKVLGALALYSPEPRTPTADQLSLLKASARITGLAVERGRAEEALKRAEESIKVVRNQLQATLNALPDLLFEVDSEGRIFRYHTHRTDLQAAQPEAFMGQRFADVLPPDAADTCQRAIDEAAQKGFSYGEIYRLASSQGEQWFELSVAPLHVDDTSKQRFVMISRDITERKRSDESLRFAANVFTHAREGIIISDVDANILDVNTAFTNIIGFSREEVLGKNPRIFNSGNQDEAFYATMWHDLQSKGHWHGEVLNRRKDGEVIAVMQTISAVRDERGHLQNYIALFSDITATKKHQAQLEYLAHYDALTELPNRLLLGDRLRQAMSQTFRRRQHLAVAYLDLDGFKAVNDTHGHEAGDQLLTALTKRMTHVLRDGDTLGRLGGDEFVAVLVDLSDIEVSVPILTRLLEAAAQPFPFGDNLLKVSASLGVTYYPQSEAVDADQLLRQADQAMYQAKQSGKNRYHMFDAEQDRHMRGHHESLEHIRQALAAGQFVLFYQPKVNMRTGLLIGAEALIRWQHPQRGLLSPAVFLPVVENQPLAIDLGEWVIDTALTQIEAWHDDGLSIPVSVNVGALQLQQPDFVSHLRTLLSQHPGVNPNELELEVLETSALEDCTGVSQVMASCQELGVGFALDDFGTGYSSLTYLKKLPANLLKVDQSFVRDMLDDPEDLAILEGVLSLAKAFRRQVIAEGVETLAHGEMLLRLGYEWAQGYAIARPMPAHDFPRWASTWDAPPAWKALKPISRKYLPALFANVEHRAWISAMINYLSGKHDAPPEQDAHQCRFGRWLEHGGLALLLGEGAGHSLDALHREIHRVAAELIALKHDGRADEVQTGISELHRLRDQLLEQLSELY